MTYSVSRAQVISVVLCNIGPETPTTEYHLFDSVGIPRSLVFGGGPRADQPAGVLLLIDGISDLQALRLPPSTSLGDPRQERAQQEMKNPRAPFWEHDEQVAYSRRSSLRASPSARRRKGRGVLHFVAFIVNRNSF